MAEPKQTKKQRIEEAREQARLAREKRERRQKRLKVLVPSLVSLGVLVIVAAIVVVVAIQPKPAPAFPGGPKNLASDGILFMQKGDTATYTPTAALKKGQKPKATEWPEKDGIAHITTYVDWSCPACKQFEGTYASSIQKLVAAGSATLEVHPIAILTDNNYPNGNDYSGRVNNAAMCIANYDPDKFLAVQTKIYDKQPAEGSSGLSMDKIIGVVHSAGLDDPKVDACIRGNSYQKYVDAATARATGTASLQGSSGFVTPTVVVNGQRWDNTGDFSEFLQSAVAA